MRQKKPKLLKIVTNEHNSIANNGKIQHQDKTVAPPVDFYNKFIRKEGQPVLDAKTYHDMMIRTLKEMRGQE